MHISLEYLQNKKVETRSPYQNIAITSVISVFYMTRHLDIMTTNENQFVPTAEGYTANELPDAMIASAATAVRKLLCLS
jgi:hypothetical protein